MKNIAIVFFMITIFCSCNPVQKKDIISGQFAHTVLLWMKNPNNSADRSKLEAGLKKLIEGSDYIRSAHLGTPAMTPRDVVDNSYTYCLIFTFDSKEAQDKYQVEPVHTAFVEECKDLWNKVLIYDSMNFLEATETLE